MRIVTRTALAFVAVAALAACDRSQAPAAAEPAAPAATPAADDTGPSESDGGLAIEAEGLRMFSPSGSAREIPFGSPQETTIGLVVGFLGAREAPQVTTNSECGAGPIQFAEFSNGLQLLFQNDQFQGWFVREAGITTVDGMGVGSTRASIEESRTIEMQDDSTLGAEFDSGGVGGFLEGSGSTATVSGLYAGLTCFFR